MTLFLTCDDHPCSPQRSPPHSPCRGMVKVHYPRRCRVSSGSSAAGAMNHADRHRDGHGPIASNKAPASPVHARTVGRSPSHLDLPCTSPPRPSLPCLPSRTCRPHQHPHRCYLGTSSPHAVRDRGPAWFTACSAPHLGATCRTPPHPPTHPIPNARHCCLPLYTPAAYPGQGPEETAGTRTGVAELPRAVTGARRNSWHDVRCCRPPERSDEAKGGGWHGGQQASAGVACPLA